MKCAQCKSDIPENISKCSKCGMVYNTHNITEENYRDIRICRKCHALMSETDDVCKMCGKIYNFNIDSKQINSSDEQSSENLSNTLTKRKLLKVLKGTIISFLILTIVIIFIQAIHLIFNNSIAEILVTISNYFCSSIFTFLFLFMINLGYFYLIGYKKLYHDLPLVEGKVVDNRVENTMGSDDIRYYPITEYTVNNNTYRNVDNIPRNKRSLINKKIKLIYKEELPIDSMVLYNYSTIGMILLVVGMIFFTILIWSILIGF